MDSILIRGGSPLVGEIEISGAKNSALKLMAACLLTDGPLELSRMPRLADTRFLGHLLARLGVVVEERAGAKLFMQADRLGEPFAPYDLVRKMRASILVLGPMVARFGEAEVALPGGWAIGSRPRMSTASSRT